MRFSTFSTFFIVENPKIKENFQTLLTFGKNAFYRSAACNRKRGADKNKIVFSNKQFVQNTITKNDEGRTNINDDAG